MIKVITYGTYDVLHYGHIRLLERAKALGDYLIVGVTSDDFDKSRGKINVQETLEERVEAVRKTGLADKIIIEEYEGQKIDDIKKYGIDIFTVGSDWIGYFDYLNEFCKVIYLDRTEGISSSEIRSKESRVSLGLVGYSSFLKKVYDESHYVNGLSVDALYTDKNNNLSSILGEIPCVTHNYAELLNRVDAIYIHSHPNRHYEEVREALKAHKHVLCESPVALKKTEIDELIKIAAESNCVLMESLRTAFAIAYSRLLLLSKTGKIGEVVSVDATCTSLSINPSNYLPEQRWNGMTAWAPTTLLPIFQLLGTDYKEVKIASKCDQNRYFDSFSKIDFVYSHAVASAKVATDVKSEGELIISGTKGYIYVPSPWWKTDYFEIRYENQSNNKRFFYQLDGEGIRYELVAFLKSINGQKVPNIIDPAITRGIVDIMDLFYTGKNINFI